MYCTVCKCPIAIRVSRSYFLVRTVHMFFQTLEEHKREGKNLSASFCMDLTLCERIRENHTLCKGFLKIRHLRQLNKLDFLQ